jgi:hypothetical protein
MYIQNKNGLFNVNACQYNYLTSNFESDDINTELVQKTAFINDFVDYKKANVLFNKQPRWAQ